MTVVVTGAGGYVGGVVTITAENVVEGDRRWEHALPVEPRRYVRVSIADKGIGIPKEHLSRIFDPYFSTKQRGSGLGLATTYSIVKNHGGFLTVDSQLGRGTTVHINFPAAGSRVVEEQPAATIRASGNKPRVLIMDDEASIRTLAANMLEFLGYETEVVDGGSAAVERFQSAMASGRPFDVVLLDLSVPGDLSVVGFDDLEEAEIVTPALTTIRQPLAEMGRIAVSLLTRLLDNQRLEALHVELATRLVVRESTGPPKL